METITAANAVSLNCDIDLMKHCARPHPSHEFNKYELVLKSCRTITNIAIDLLSYILKLFASFGWQCAHTMSCTKFIRLNQRALLNHFWSIQFAKYIKLFGADAARYVQPTFRPFVRIFSQKHYYYGNISSLNNNNELEKKPKGSFDSSNAPVTEDTECMAKKIELEILWEPKNGTPYQADIVFVHGLHGSSDSTWKQGEWVHQPEAVHDNCIQIVHHELSTGSSSDAQNHFRLSASGDSNESECRLLESISQCWPKDWLPIDFPTARVSALNYDTDPYLWRPVWYPKLKRHCLAVRALDMIQVLVENQIGVNRPIIWVGHSKGGLYIKQIIISAHECNADWLWKSSQAVLFYSVPHRGSPLAELNMPLFTRSIEMIEIEKNFPTIMQLHRRFTEMCRNGILKMDIFSFIEMKFTELSVFYLRIIGTDSGDPGIGGVCSVPLDHLDVCKPRNRSCFLYRQLANMIESAMNTYSRPCI